MAPPKGNKYALGNTNSGRPPIYDKVKMAQKLLDWAEKPTSTSLVGFCAQEKIPQEYISVWAKESDEFSQSLKITRSILAARRDEFVDNETMNYGRYMATQGYYDSFWHEYQDSLKVRDAEIKANAESKSNQPITVNITDYSKSK